MSSKYLLIHGTSVTHTYKNFRERDEKYGFFKGAKEMVDKGEADLFLWSPSSKDFNWLEILTVLPMVVDYSQEREYIQNNKVRKRLFEKLTENLYEVILAHSLGGFLLQLAINKFGIPDSVKKIVTLASDAPAGLEIENQMVAKRLENGSLKWENYFCPWDQALISSFLFNFKVPAGLIGSKSKFVKNNFYKMSLKYFPNTHVSIISDKNFLEKVVKI